MFFPLFSPWRGPRTIDGRCGQVGGSWWGSDPFGPFLDAKHRFYLFFPKNAYRNYRTYVQFRGVHGYTDKGGELKNKRKNVFEEALDK